jgi:ubiquinone/menaquinone biosynthesis C-methylase UbiE
VDALLAARRGARVTGVDMTGEMLAVAARDPGGARFVRALAERLPFGDGSFDVALSNGVLNLCPDKPRALAELARVVKPGGVVYGADILLEEGVEEATVKRLGAWSD